VMTGSGSSFLHEANTVNIMRMRGINFFIVFFAFADSKLIIYPFDGL
jgi:hypothetical protein